MKPPRYDMLLYGWQQRLLATAMAWIGFGLTAYLAWSSLGNLPIAGCTGDGVFDCDAVHSSGWSRWLGIPVALLGLACYSMLAGLAIPLTLAPRNLRRFVEQAFASLSLLAGGAAIWFTVLQLLVIGKVCPVCMALHLCGLVLGGLAIWQFIASLLQRGSGPQSAEKRDAGIIALRSTIATQAPHPHRHESGYTWRLPILANLVAGMALALLIGGQILYPAKEYSEVTVELDAPFSAPASPRGEPQPRGPLASEPSDPNSDSGSELVGAEGPANSATVAGIDDARGDLNLFDDSRPFDRGQIVEDSTDELFAENSPASQADPPSPGRTVTMLRGKLSFDIDQFPVLGSRDAPHVIVEMLAYDCPHCRKMYPILEKARQRYGDELAVIVLPVPLERACNKYVTGTASHRGSCTLARHALAVAKVDPQAFEEFHAWLMNDSENTPTIDDVIAKADDSVDRAELKEIKYGDALRSQIEHNVELFATLRAQHQSNHKFGLPVQIVGNGVISGVADVDSLCQVWEERLGITPQ